MPRVQPTRGHPSQLTDGSRNSTGHRPQWAPQLGSGRVISSMDYLHTLLQKMLTGGGSARVTRRQAHRGPTDFLLGHMCK